MAFQALPSSAPSNSAPRPIGELVLHALSPVLRYAPTWLGLWTVELPRGKILEGFPTADEILKEARTLMPIVEDLRDAKFFRIFKIDLSQECPFWAREDLCSSPTGSCAVCECTPDQVPLPWKQKPIEHFVDRRLSEEKQQSPWLDPRGVGLPGAAGEAETSFLALLSGQEAQQSTYVDLSLNPPGFTAYRGRNIWGLIYKENCLRDEETTPKGELAESSKNGECTEEEFFERIISGLQTAVMTLASEYNAPLNWRIAIPFTAPSPYNNGRHFYNLELFRWRLAGSRAWLENLYLDFSLLLRTLAKVSGVVEECPCYTGTDAEDSVTKEKLRTLLRTVSKGPSADSRRVQNGLFRRKQALAIQQFTNISRIFDCIECEKCRLHGKVKLTALQVAIKAAAEGSPVRTLERNEITALVNALGYFGDAVLIVNDMHRRAATLRTVVIAASCALVVLLIWFARRPRSPHTPVVTEPTLGDLVHELEMEEKQRAKGSSTTTRQRTKPVSQ
eukprot:Protomagalhaensia_wolfi_Nauph_80__448@NODE_124_length_3563_cov_180_024688_g95_i0_p1_GENE_NODE_124_length_3563_cov_180_024688_g95_i0NODE_124_length_3563_cov_180_024688_g95_i0_p1_ORF_typecomplete_len564_score125_12ERO1/PF04137_15/1_9e82INCENP_ARKbind/PF03941_15/1_4e03INCENP_ARKbind/PF03941_15/5_1e03INCENP_ARKbind/PF03941_15/2ShK/PF01549_24/1_1e04ShK/PF01549_24/0_6ShK/PF01549_24/2_2e03_NODE_124_length_3563_cov_180_024688_g95_i01791693